MAIRFSNIPVDLVHLKPIIFCHFKLIPQDFILSLYDGEKENNPGWMIKNAALPSFKNIHWQATVWHGFMQKVSQLS